MSMSFFLTWAILTLATQLSWWLDNTAVSNWIGTAVLLIAFVKARLVLMVFMEVGAAPAALRWCCEAWVIIACTAVIATYWYTPLT